MNMKRYFSIFTYIVAISFMMACQTGDLISDNDTTVEKTISFATKVSSTRTVQTTTTTLQGYGKFNVATFLTDNDNTHYFADEVLFRESNWISETSRYWPVSYNLNMFAYSPYADFITVNDETNCTDYSLTYSCPADIPKQIDLLVETVENQGVDNGAVALDFNHALSSLKFNVKFEDESNVTLNNISINYVGIERERTYNFLSQSWGDLTSVYFDSSSGASTDIDIFKTLTTSDVNKNPIIFNDIEDLLMIIPQPVSMSEDDPHYISIQVSYTLNSTQDANKTEVLTGVMPLPAPNSRNEYKMGELYTYNIIVNGDKISFGEISITDQDEPMDAYGNINLGLISSPLSAEDIGYTTDDDDSKAQYYYTTALRVKNLLLDGVRDFVVVGSMGASGDNHLGDGKLGYYGTESSPFFIGAHLANHISGEDCKFSIDLRGTYDYPEFQHANNDTEGNVTTPTNSDIKPTDPIMIAGLFSGVSGLKEVILPHGLMAIGNHAFEDCDALESIDIADVLHIEVGAFQHSSALKKVDNGALTRIHDNGFDGCSALTTIDLSKVTQIDQYGFVNCSSLTNVDLSHLDIIGIHAFDGCSNLTLKTNTTIPAFESVADYAFSRCSKLGVNGSRIDLTETTHVGDHAFNECTEIMLSDGDLFSMKTIGGNAFTNCKHIGSEYEVTMPYIESIGASAFAGCSKLNIVDGLENLTKINISTFQDCTNLTGYSSTSADKILKLPLVEVVDILSFNASGVTNVAFNKNKLTTINDYAFNNCKSLVTLSGLEKVSSVGMYAFGSCSALEELDLPSLKDEGWGRDFFSVCSSLKKLSLPLLTIDEITYIDSDGDEQINSIVGMIGSDYDNIESVDLRGLVVDIPAWGAFQKKEYLKTVNFASAKSVGNGAFYNCKALEVADFSSATSIGSMALYGCNGLKRLNLSGLIDSDNIGEGVFWKFVNGAECELWLSDEQAAEVTGDDKTTWQDITWKAIYKVSDNKPFIIE